MRSDFQSASKKKPAISTRRRKKALYSRDRALHDAVCLNNADKITQLMRAGASPARVLPSVTKDSCGRRQKTTALHMAVLENRMQAMRDMIVHEPPLNAKDAQGRTALHVAVKTGNIWMVDILLHAGADRNARTPGGKKPLELIEGSPETGAAAEIIRLFHQAEGRDLKKSLATDQRINVRTPLQLKKPGPGA